MKLKKSGNRLFAVVDNYELAKAMYKNNIALYKMFGDDDEYEIKSLRELRVAMTMYNSIIGFSVSL